MVSVSSGDLAGWLLLFFWPFVRILAFMSVAPIFGENAVPRPIKIAIAAFVAFLIAPTLGPVPDASPVSFEGLAILIEQVAIGLALGMVMRVTFAAIQAAGDYIGLQMGLGFASFYSQTLGINAMVLSQFLNTIALLLFLAFNGHLILIGILADTFTVLPIGGTGLAAPGWIMAARWGETIFTAGVSLALPLIAALLTINLAMGILNRASPQLSIFSVGFPLTLIVGIAVLTFFMPDLGGLFSRLFAQTFDEMRAIIAAMAGAAPTP